MAVDVQPRPKLSHADADRAVRTRKAQAIEERLQHVVPDLGSKDVLDVGTGSGIIASYFAGRVGSLVSVDVVDERIDHVHAFRLIDSEELPFKSGSFDVAISNFVIEHTDDRQRHLSEIARVLRPGGVCYLSGPNRYTLVESHFHLPFLSWLPPHLSDRYVRFARKGERYDVQPATNAEYRRMAAAAGLEVADLSQEVMRRELARRLGFSLGGLGLLKPAYPSFIFVLTKPVSGERTGRRN